MRLAAIILIAVAVAGAAPQVEIKAQTQLSLGRVRLRDNGQVEVTGQLVDKLTGDGIAGQKVHITIAGHEATARTDADGQFKVELPASDGTQQVELAFAGANRLDAATPVTVTTDPAKAQLQLSIVKLGDDLHGAKLRVNAIGDEGPVSVPVTIAVGPVAGDVFRTLRGSVDSGNGFVVLRQDAGGAGLHRVRATFAGDDNRQRATAEVTVELVATTTTTMMVSSTHVAFEDDVVVTGRVTDDDDHLIEHAAVTLTSGDKRLAQGATGDDGRYRFKIEAQILGAGTWGIQVQADPGTSYVKASRSQPEVVKVAAPQPVPVSYTVAAFVLTALAAGAFFLARKQPWHRLRRPAPPAEVPSQQGEVEQVQGGLVVAKPGMISTLRRATDDGFSGVVRDTVRGRPVEHAIVRVRLGEVERELRTAADGSFALEQLGAGDWQTEVAAPGHVTECFAVTIPHRGELRGVRVDLVPVRERVFQLYRRAAEPVLPETRLWGIWSPRQIVDHVRSKRPSPALSELTDFVEEIYFSPRLAAETVLPQASERVDRAIHERTRRGI